MEMHQITTPALLVDIDAMEFNLQRMAEFFADKHAKLRPHFKNHKVPLFAWKQLRAGAIGITCATMREAEILVHHGIGSILIANEIAGETKAERLAELSRHASVMVAIDNCNSAKDLARAQRNRKTQIEIVVDIDIGLGRCGVRAGRRPYISPGLLSGRGSSSAASWVMTAIFRRYDRAQTAMIWFAQAANPWLIPPLSSRTRGFQCRSFPRAERAPMPYPVNIRALPRFNLALTC